MGGERYFRYFPRRRAKVGNNWRYYRYSGYFLAMTKSLTRRILICYLLGMSVAKENAVVHLITKLLKEYGAWYVKTTGVSLVGCPDLLVCYRGVFIALEVKREHGGEYGVTRKQAYEITRLERAGAIACVVANKLEVKAILDGIDLRLGDYNAP